MLHIKLNRLLQIGFVHRQPHPSIVPLFAETLQTYSEDLDRDGFGLLRATEDNLTFAPTQQTIREQSISQITSLETSLIGVRF